MGKDAPAAPDYTGAANAQAQASKENTNYQTWANRPNINTPWGSQTWSRGAGTAGTPGTAGTFDQSGYDAAMSRWNAQPEAFEYTNEGGSIQSSGPGRGAAPTREQYTTGGTPGTPGSSGDVGPGSWETTITLSPDQQAALDAQQRITKGRSNAAETLLGQATSAFQTPMDYGSLPKLSTDISASPIQKSLTDTAGGWREKGQSAIEQLMAPQLAQRRGALESRLANQGITMGSDAWNAAMRSQGDTETRAGLSAIDAGRQESDSLFGKDLQSGQFANSAQNQGFNQSLQSSQFGNQSRQQAMAEMLQRRGQPLNELNALLTQQQIGMPQMPSFQPAGVSQAPNLLGAAQNQYGAALDASNASNAGIGGLMNGMFSLGSAGIANPAGMASLFSLSDKRLKRDISHVFTLPNHVKIYKYRFIGSDRMELGVLAQEVQEIVPDAVTVDGHGFLRVNYDKVLA